MRFWLFAAVIGLSSFALFSVALSAALACVTPFVMRRLEGYSPRSRATLLFGVRVLPAVFATLASLGVALPIYLAYEPPDSAESLSLTLTSLATIGVVLLTRGAWRAAGAWRATQAVRHDWLARGRRLDGFDTHLPIYAIDASFPTVAVVGVAKPIMFIADRVLRECPAAEVRAMVRHEAAHVTVRDNLKRFVLRGCPDLLGTSGPLERAWARAAEEAADAAAAAEQPGSAVDLAQALVRVARLAPSAPALALASSFYPGGSIESRVRNLLDSSTAPEAPTPFGWVALGLTLSITAIVLAAPVLHQAMESVIASIP